jgi:hypothetical protein
LFLMKMKMNFWKKKKKVKRTSLSTDKQKNTRDVGTGQNAVWFERPSRVAAAAAAGGGDE